MVSNKEFVFITNNKIDTTYRMIVKDIVENFNEKFPIYSIEYSLLFDGCSSKLMIAQQECNKIIKFLFDLPPNDRNALQSYTQFENKIIKKFPSLKPSIDVLVNYTQTQLLLHKHYMGIISTNNQNDITSTLYNWSPEILDLDSLLFKE